MADPLWYSSTLYKQDNRLYMVTQGPRFWKVEAGHIKLLKKKMQGKLASR
jgi:hypothetical protein